VTIDNGTWHWSLWNSTSFILKPIFPCTCRPIGNHAWIYLNIKSHNGKSNMRLVNDSNMRLVSYPMTAANKTSNSKILITYQRTLTKTTKFHLFSRIWKRPKIQAYPNSENNNKPSQSPFSNLNNKPTKKLNFQNS